MKIYMQGREFYFVDEGETTHLIGSPTSLPTMLKHELTTQGIQVYAESYIEDRDNVYTDFLSILIGDLDCLQEEAEEELSAGIGNVIQLIDEFMETTDDKS